MEALTAEQLAVVDQSVSAQTVVVGGPGSGKTNTLAHRVVKLFDSGQVSDPQDVLVLSFTRAAVAELRQRLSAHPAARLVQPVTIDAFARRIVRQAGADTPTGRDFDTVVRDAAVVLDSPEAPAFKHVIVDEVQDVSGVRQVLISAALRRSIGFTILGDPAQSIYGFRSDSGASLLDAVAADFPSASRLDLTVDHRTTTSTARVAAGARAAVLQAGGVDARDRLLRVLRDLPRVSEASLALVLRSAQDGPAVICRTNGDVLRLSTELRRQEVRHRIQSGADASVPPRWIADVLRTVEGDSVTREAYGSLSTERGAAWADASWDALRIASSGTPEVVQMQTLRERLGRVPQTPVDGGPPLPVLSTVHRVKGLEYDRVFVVEPVPRRNDDVVEEARVLYVAMTRARHQITMVESTRLPFAMEPRGGRWVTRPWRSQAPDRVELKVGDIERTTPYLDDGGAGLVQRHLRTRVASGDPVTVERREAYGQSALVVVHEGQPIGQLAGACADAIARIAGGPRALTDAYVETVSSAAGHPDATDAAGIGSAGLWLVPELSGFARLV